MLSPSLQGNTASLARVESIGRNHTGSTCLSITLVPLNRNPFYPQTLLILFQVLPHSLALASQSSLASKKANTVPTFPMQRWRTCKVKRFAQGHPVGEERDSQARTGTSGSSSQLCPPPPPWPGLRDRCPADPALCPEASMQARLTQAPPPAFALPGKQTPASPSGAQSGPFHRNRASLSLSSRQRIVCPRGPSPSLESSSCGESSQTALGLPRRSLGGRSGPSGCWWVRGEHPRPPRFRTGSLGAGCLVSAQGLLEQTPG